MVGGNVGRGQNVFRRWRLICPRRKNVRLVRRACAPHKVRGMAFPIAGLRLRLPPRVICSFPFGAIRVPSLSGAAAGDAAGSGVCLSAGVSSRVPVNLPPPSGIGWGVCAIGEGRRRVAPGGRLGAKRRPQPNYCSGVGAPGPFGAAAPSPPPPSARGGAGGRRKALAARPPGAVLLPIVCPGRSAPVPPSFAGRVRPPRARRGAINGA